MNPFSRRGFLKAVGIGAGAAIGTRISGSSLFGVARAATSEPTSVVCVYLDGGINAIFTGADAFTNNAFGVTGDNVTNMGGVVVDNALANAIPQAIRTRVASIGIQSPSAVSTSGVISNKLRATNLVATNAGLPGAAG